MVKLRHRELKWLVQGYTVCMWNWELRPGIAQYHVGATSRESLQTCSAELSQRMAVKKLCFFFEQHLQIFAPGGRRLRTCFPQDLGRGTASGRQAGSFFEVSFYLKQSCKFGIRSGDRAVFILKWKHGFEWFSMAYKDSRELHQMSARMNAGRQPL